MTSAMSPADAPIDGDAVDEDAEHPRLGLQEVVAGEDRLALRAERRVDREVGELALLRLGVGLRHRALVGHERVEGGAVDREAGLLRDLEREVDREAEGVVQQEGGVARERRNALLLGVLDRDVEDRRAAREGAEEGLLLAERETRGAIPVVLDLRVRVAHRVRARRRTARGSSGLDAEQAHRRGRRGAAGGAGCSRGPRCSASTPSVISMRLERTWSAMTRIRTSSSWSAP